MSVVDRPKDIDVWVLAGQSNMEGAGRREGCLAPDSRVWCFSSAGNWEVAEDPLHRLWESFTPVHQNIRRASLEDEQAAMTDAELAELERRDPLFGGGLGVSFGKAMADALARPIGLIPAAHGGVTLEQFSPAHKAMGTCSLYGAMLERIRLAGGNLRGILWYQGESDGLDLSPAGTYADRFDAWVHAVRGDTGIEDLPVIVVQLGRYILPAGEVPPEGWNLVREAQRTLPDRMAGTAVTSAIDLGLRDIVHIGTPGLIRLGRRMARLALGLTDKPDTLRGPKVERIVPFGPEANSRTSLRLVLSGVTGGLSPSENIHGFEILPPQGAEADKWLYPIEARSEENSIIVDLSLDAPVGARLTYGQGLNPTCAVVDEADMPLCTFAPMPIG